MSLWFIWQVDNLYIGLAQEIQGIFIQAIGNRVDKPGDAGIDQGLGAVQAGEVGHITCAAAGGNAMQGGLDNGIGLGVDGAHTMPIDQQVPDLITVGLAGGGAIEAGGQDALLIDKDTADKCAITGAAFRDSISNFHEI